jgi:hypothetical protein
MKNLLLLLSVCTGFFLAKAQIRDVPAAVTEAFKQKFPSATDVSWKDHLANFEASFKMESHDYKANFNGDGQWKRTEKMISFEELPGSVKTSFNDSKYSGWKKGSVAEVDDHDDGFRYRVFVQKNAVQKKFIYFDRDGKLVKAGNI